VKLACIGIGAEWQTGTDEQFFVQLLNDAGLPTEKMTFASSSDPVEADFVLLSGRDSLRPFIDVDPGLVLARPFVIADEPLQVGFPVLHWSSYRRHPGYREHLETAVRYLKQVARARQRGEFWFELAPLGCVICNGVEAGIGLSEHWLPYCPAHERAVSAER
jgi:hypothetical protein